MLPTLPAHHALTIEHNSHRLAQRTTLEGMADYPPRFWVSAEEIERALERDSIWMARWVLPGADGLVVRLASDLFALLDAIAAEQSVGHAGRRNHTKVIFRACVKG